MYYGHILLPFGNFEAIWYIFPHFGILCPEKSGNPGTVGSTFLDRHEKVSGKSVASKVGAKKGTRHYISGTRWQQIFAGYDHQQTNNKVVFS
jgi:hypothetical protein